ncbi:MAG: alpha/beta hydrolase-fold protein, partial [Pseudomonadota bacterium]
MRRLASRLSTPLDTLMLDMPALAENRIGASNVRQVSVWRPTDVPPENLPLIVCLAAYLSSGPSLTGWRNFGESVPERLDRLYEQGTLEPAVVVFVDSFNRLGGNQFVNSPIIGNWTDALADDLIPAIEHRYGCGGPGLRGLFGHSSGGYGALHNLASRPDVWSAAASHAGDCGFDLVYRPELPKAVRTLASFESDIEEFLKAFWLKEKPKGEEVATLMMLAMAASYDPVDENGGPIIRLPVSLDTCEIIESRWAKWLAYDPLSFAAAQAEALRSSKLIYVDCGRQDEFNILYGSRRLNRILETARAPVIYEEFDGGHGTIGPRYEVSLPKLISSLMRVSNPVET